MVKIKQRNIISFLMLGLILIMAGCAKTEGETSLDSESGEDAKHEITIGYVIGTLNDTFPTLIYNSAEEKASELGINIELADAEDDLIRQQDLVNTHIENDVDALIVMPVDTSGMDTIIKSAQNADIPLVFIDRNPYVNREEEIPEGVYVVGTDNRQAGVLQAEFMGELLDGEGGYINLMGILGQESTNNRTAGVNETLEESYPKMELLAEETGEWARDQAVSITENLILTYGDNLNIIFSNNDEMALGAVQAVQSTGRTDIEIIGIDAIPDALEVIRQGRMAGTIFQDGVGQGHAAVEVINDIVSGEYNGENAVLIDYQVVTPENVDEYE